MKHIDEDLLLEYALEIPENRAGHEVVAAHLRECSECRNRFQAIIRDIEVLGSLRPHWQALRLPNPRAGRRQVRTFMKAAVLITFGMLVGFGAGRWIDNQPAEVSYAYLTLIPPTDVRARCAASDATDIPPGYYDEILRSRE